jgi:hypothetical protein
MSLNLGNNYDKPLPKFKLPVVSMMIATLMSAIASVAFIVATVYFCALVLKHFEII